MHFTGTDSNSTGPTFGCAIQPQSSVVVVLRVLGAIDGHSLELCFLSVLFCAVQSSVAVAVVRLAVLRSEPLAVCVCCSENECNEVKVLAVCTCVDQATGRFTFGFLVAIPGEQSPFYLLDFLGAKTGMCFRYAR